MFPGINIMSSENFPCNRNLTTTNIQQSLAFFYPVSPIKQVFCEIIELTAGLNSENVGYCCLCLVVLTLSEEDFKQEIIFRVLKLCSVTSSKHLCNITYLLVDSLMLIVRMPN